MKDLFLSLAEHVLKSTATMMLFYPAVDKMKEDEEHFMGKLLMQIRVIAPRHVFPSCMCSLHQRKAPA